MADVRWRPRTGIAVDYISVLRETDGCPGPARNAESWVTEPVPGMAGTVVAVCPAPCLGRVAHERRGSQTAHGIGMGTNGVNRMMTICSFVDAT